MIKKDNNCLEPGKIEALKMRDLQTKSAINSTDPLVLLQATNLAFSGIESSHNIQCERDDRGFPMMFQQGCNYVNRITKF